ncbi:MAG: NAD(P)(+) transhydrogenase (Re/Si-specific) subunit beta, partial [Planctomycetota bacterium]|nr:NAD(P)(+) transhydrogenase (Re/Si-specific) subunit beta [Planctomycetota bacterium]
MPTTPLQLLTLAQTEIPVEAVAPPVHSSGIYDLGYLVAAILFILGLKRLASPRTARGGNAIAALGMLIAILSVVLAFELISFGLVLVALIIGGGIGAFMAVRVQMTQMPQMVAMFNGFGGLASALVAFGEWLRMPSGVEQPVATLFMIGLSILIGGVTLTGSLVAAGKLHGTLSGAPIKIPAQLPVNIALVALAALFIFLIATVGGPAWAMIPLILLALALGVALTIPIGGADMPVMVSLLNSYSGLAAAA